MYLVSAGTPTVAVWSLYESTNGEKKLVRYVDWATWLDFQTAFSLIYNKRASKQRKKRIKIGSAVLGR